jgi:hypothetical protein
MLVKGEGDRGPRARVGETASAFSGHEAIERGHPLVPEATFATLVLRIRVVRSLLFARGSLWGSRSEHARIGSRWSTASPLDGATP